MPKVSHTCRIGVACAILALLAACSSPSARWVTARNILTAAQDGILDLHAAGVIKDDELVRIDVAVQTARRGLTVAESQLPDGGDDFELWMAVVDEALDQLIIYEQDRLRRE